VRSMLVSRSVGCAVLLVRRQSARGKALKANHLLLGSSLINVQSNRARATAGLDSRVRALTGDTSKPCIGRSTSARRTCEM
jgi:hypothetical protein